MNFKFPHFAKAPRGESISNFQFPIIGYLLIIVGLFFYSFTQIDLGLTLSRASIWQTLEQFFKNIGYFQRPLSSYIYVFLIVLLFVFYFLILWAINKNKITQKQTWFIILFTSLVLTFSYNAFSYDLFNYIFDAKIVTYYQQNPYIHKALDFPNDHMLSFMHWTHRLYPYGPVWLGLTVPLSFVGFQFFLPTFFLFKILMMLSFLGSAFFIGKILKKVSPKDALFGVSFFALNPLVIVESLISSHNDIVMILFSLWAIYLLLINKIVRSFILLFLSIGIKFATLFLLPIFALIYFLVKVKKKSNWNTIFLIMVFFMITPVVLASYRTNFQPWYLLNVLPFCALISRRYYIFIPSIIFSFVALLQYLPFLYLGNWNDPVPSILSSMILSAVVLSGILILVFFLKSRFVGK